MPTTEDANRRDFADVMEFFGGTPTGPRPTDSRPYYSSPSVPSGDFDDLIRETADRYGVREDIARAMAYVESGFNPRAVPPNGESSAKGLYQFIDATAAEEGIDPFDPAQSTDAALRRLRRHLDQFGGRYDLAVAAHRLGPTGAAESGGQFDAETADYVGRILGGPQSRVPSDFEDVMAFMGGPASTPKQPEPPSRAPQEPAPPPPATVEPEPGPPLALPPLQRAGPTNLPELMAMPKEGRERFMAERGIPVQPLPPEPTPGEKAKQAGISLLRTVPEFGAAAGEMLGILGSTIDNFAANEGPPRPGPPSRGGVSMARRAEATKSPEDYATYKLGQIIRDWTEKNLPQDERLRNSFLYTVLPQAVGSTLLFWGVGAGAGALRLGAVGTRLAVAGAGATFAAPQAYREAVAAGADPDTAMRAAFQNMLAGSSEVVGLEVILRSRGVPQTAIGYITRAIISGLDEGGQEFGQQVWQNLIARNYYDPDRGWNEGLMEATGAGGIVGVLMSTIQGAAQATRARRAMAAARAAPGVAEEATLPPPPPGGPSVPPEEAAAPVQTEIAKLNVLFAKEQLAKLVDEAERIGARIDGGVAGPNDAAKMVRIVQEIQRLSAQFGIEASVQRRILPEKTPPLVGPATGATLGQASERQLAVERLRTLKPWITEGEIQAQETQEGLDRLVEVAEARRDAAREKRILERATPEERAQYERRGAPQKLILKAIEDRIAVPPPTGEPGATVTEEDIQAAIEAAPETEGARKFARDEAAREKARRDADPSWRDVPIEEVYRGAAERLRARLGAPPVAPAPAQPAAEAAPAPVLRIEAKDLEGHETVDVYVEKLKRLIAEAKAAGDEGRLANLEAALQKRQATAVPTAPTPAERRAAPAREIDMTKVRPEVAWFADDYVKRAGQGRFEVEQFWPLNRDEERLIADAIDRAAARRPPAPGQNVFLTPKEEEYIKGFREAKGKGVPPPEPPTTPKGPSAAAKARQKRLETMEGKLGHWWGVILEQGPISRDSLQRTYVGEDPSKPGYKESLKVFNEIIAGLNKKWGPGLIVKNEGGMRLDEAAQMAAEKGFAGGDAIEARNEILRMIDELSGRKPPKVSGRRKGFGKIDPELASMTRDVAAGDLKEGESFTTGDGNYYTVTAKAPGEITLSSGPEAQGGQTITLDEFDLVPIVGRAGPRAYATGAGPRAMGERARTGDPFQDADAELKELLFTTGTYQVSKGAVTQERLVAALTNEFGPNIEQYVPGLWRLLTRLPGMRRFITPPEVPRGPIAGGGLSVEQRPGGAEAGRRVPAAGGRGPGEPIGGVRPPPPPPTERPGERPTPAAPPAAARPEPGQVVLTIDRTQTDRGVATVSRELLPELTGEAKTVHAEYSTPERLAEMTKKFGGKRPMRHQVEQFARSVMAWAKGHAYINGDGTGTGKTLTTGLAIDWLLRKKPDARIMIVVRNPGIMKQWHADVLSPLGLKVHEVKGPFEAKKGVVNFVTYTRLQMLHTANLLGLVEGYHPDLLVFDESHALKKWYAGTTKWAQAGEIITGNDYSDRVLFLSATPFESILHTGYLTRTAMWGNWRKWLEDTMGIRYNADKDRWEGLTPAKVRKLHEALVSQGRMGKNEIDFQDLKNSSGQKITLTSENVLVPLTEANGQAYAGMNAVFDGFLEEALMNNDRAMLRMLRGIQHFFRRSYDEAHKLPAAIERARKDVANGKTVLFFLLRKNDSSVEKWWNRYEEDPDRYPPGSRMPQILEALKHVQPPIAVPSPVKMIHDAFPQAVKITGDEVAGGMEREANIQALMQGKAKVGIITIAAGAEALNLQDKIGTHPRVSYIVSTPYTASTAKQVMGRGFRLGSESNAEILWLFNDTPSDRRIATNMAWLSRMMGAAVSGEVENPNADELERFLFPELDRNGSNGGTAREMAEEEVEPQVVIGWMTRERRELQARVDQIRRGPEWPNRQDEINEIEQDIRLIDGVVDELRRRILKPVDRPVTIEASDRLIIESPPDPKTGKPSQKEMFKPQVVDAQKEMLRQRLLAIQRRMIQAKTEPIVWTDDTLFGLEEKKDIERRQGRLPGTEPKPRDMAGPSPTLRVPGRPVKPSGRPWLWTIWEKLGVAEKARIKSRNQMLNDYLRNIGLKSFIGRMGLAGRGVRARYWPGAQYARRRTANDIEAAAHESGHFLDEILFGLDPSGELGSVSNADMRRFRGELLPLATPAQGRDPFPEGLAEFVRLYITDNAKAQRVAPKFYPWFEARMQADPRTDQVLIHMQTLRQEYEAHEQAGWEQQFGAMFRSQDTVDGRVPTATPFRRIHRMLYWSATMTEWLDRKAARTLGMKVENLPLHLSSSKAFTLLSGRFEIIDHFMEDGTFHPGRSGVVTGPGLLEIADIVGHEQRAFDMYTTAMHAKNLRDNLGENIEETIGIKSDWIERAIAKYGQNAKFKRAAHLLERYRRAILDVAEWGGLIDATHKKKLLERYLDFRPLFRLMDEDLASRPRREAGSARLAGLSAPIFRRKGSTRDILPVFEAWHRYTFLTIDRAYKNRALLTLVETAKIIPGGGDFIHRVPMQQWPVGVDLSRIKQALIRHGVDQQQIDDAIAEDFMRVYIPSWMQPRAPYDWVWRNGNRELYYFDPDFYRLAEGMEEIHRSMIYRIFATPARMMRGGISVYNPIFWLRQIAPQVLNTAIQSESAPRFIGKFPVAFKQALADKEIVAKYRRAETGMATFMGLDQRALSNLLRIKMMRTSGEHPFWWMNPMNIARYFMAYSARAGMRFEIAAGRLAAAKAAGLHEAQTREEMTAAGLAARKSDIDWGRLGILSRWVTGLSPYFGSYMTGQERVASEILNHPVRVLWRMMILLGPPALAVWFWNRRDDENEKQWRNTPSYAKNSNWVIHHPDPKKEPFQSRLPQEYGWFVSALWAVLDNMADKDPEVFRSLARDFVHNLNPILRAIPAAVRSEVEIFANESLYTRQPVYPEGRLPEYTYWPWTTQSAIDIGRAINIPPAIVEHEVRGKLGTLGEETLRLADVARGLKTPAQLPAHATPFFGAFRGAYPRSSGEYVNRFYEVFKEAELVYRTGRLPELLMKRETGPLFKDRADAIRIYASGRGLAAALAGYNRILQIVEADPKLSPEEKRGRQEDIYRKKNEMAERWWRNTMKLLPPETGRGMIRRLLSPGTQEEARP